MQCNIIECRADMDHKDIVSPVPDLMQNSEAADKAAAVQCLGSQNSACKCMSLTQAEQTSSLIAWMRDRTWPWLADTVLERSSGVTGLALCMPAAYRCGMFVRNHRDLHKQQQLCSYIERQLTPSMPVETLPGDQPQKSKKQSVDKQHSLTGKAQYHSSGHLTLNHVDCNLLQLEEHNTSTLNLHGCTDLPNIQVVLTVGSKHPSGIQ